MQLRPHQEQALQSMLDNDKGQVIVPTGGGKTMCMIMDTVRQLKDVWHSCCSCTTHITCRATLQRVYGNC